MQLLEIQNIWFAESWSTQAIFWTIAIIASLLLLVLLVYSLFSEESEASKQPTAAKIISLEARTVLLFFTVFGWTATLSSYFPTSFEQSLLYGTTAGLAIVLFVNLRTYFAKKLSANSTLTTETGRVLASIPPHRAGIGKVYMQSNRLPIELDAVTIGRELPVGAPVRIVDMLDDHTAIVEPIDSRPGGFEE